MRFTITLLALVASVIATPIALPEAAPAPAPVAEPEPQGKYANYGAYSNPVATPAAGYGTYKTYTPPKGGYGSYGTYQKE